MLPVVGPFTLPVSDYFIPNDFIANDMWINGVITDATAGTAQCQLEYHAGTVKFLAGDWVTRPKMHQNCQLGLSRRIAMNVAG